MNNKLIVMIIALVLIFPLHISVSGIKLNNEINTITHKKASLSAIAYGIIINRGEVTMWGEDFYDVKAIHVRVIGPGEPLFKTFVYKNEPLLIQKDLFIGYVGLFIIFGYVE